MVLEIELHKSRIVQSNTFCHKIKSYLLFLITMSRTRHNRYK